MDRTAVSNYHYSGMSTPEAIQHLEAHRLAGMPRPLRWLIRLGLLRVAMTVVCDGCGAQTRLATPALIETSTPGVARWKNSEWSHQGRLDFCEACSHNGTAERAVNDGARPLGTYSFDQP